MIADCGQSLSKVGETRKKKRQKIARVARRGPTTKAAAVISISTNWGKIYQKKIRIRVVKWWPTASAPIRPRMSTWKIDPHLVKRAPGSSNPEEGAPNIQRRLAQQLGALEVVQQTTRRFSGAQCVDQRLIVFNRELFFSLDNPSIGLT